jgi:hypothetical protein
MTIGPAGDYTTINDAVESLEIQGVNGPVVFNIADGVYEEQVEINQISGTSETNTVTFQSESRDSSRVTLIHEAVSEDDNYIVRFNGPSHLIFKHLSFKTANSSYGKAIYFENFTQYVEFYNCHFRGITYSGNVHHYHLIYCSNVNVDYLTFENCRIDSCASGIALSSGQSNNLIMGIHINNNTFSNVGYVAIDLTHTHMPQISANHIRSLYYGLRMNSAHGPTLISKNTIISRYEGMDIHLLGYGGDEAIIANNFISSENNEASYVTGHYLNIFNNSIFSNQKLLNGSALYVEGTQNPYSIKIINNNICRMREGRALHVKDGWFISECRNNNLYSAGNFIAYWDSVDCIDLAELRLKSGMNETSLSVYPNYISDTDLHTIAPWLNAGGMPLTEVEDDIDG